MEKQVKGTVRTLGACLLSWGMAIALTGWMSLGIGLFGFAPETLILGDVAAPLSALFIGGWWLGRVTKRCAGWKLGLCAVAFWLGAWLLLTGRLSPEGWWRDGLLSLNSAHLMSWLAALAVSGLGGWLGARFSSRASFGAAILLLLSTLWVAQWWGGAFYRAESDALVFSREEDDGTRVRLLRYDLNAVELGVYDADSDDAQPRDDRNATWLGQAMPLVWRKVERATGGKTLCVVNGAFFGADFPYIAHHEAPIVQNGVARYNSRTLESDWPTQNCLLGWKRENGGTRLALVEDIPFSQLTPRFEGALGGVRALIVAGQSLQLEPGIGGTTLRCSRTSVAWKEGVLYILSVRDPDGEAVSVRANKRENAGATGVQVGGWDVRQVQQFWEKRRVGNAVLFDGGESTQLAFPTADGRVLMSHSSYHFTRTPFYLNRKPVRFVWPMLPPFEANGGVLNYFYVAAKS